MPSSKKYLGPLLPEHLYHIYNRTNNKEILFRNDKNRLFFLKQYGKYVGPYVKTYSYSLLDNHFHFLIGVRPQLEILNWLSTLDIKQLTQKEKKALRNPYEEIWLQHLVECQFLRLFTSYAMRFNRAFKRNGNLFHRPFKRVEINTDSQLTQVVFYTHANAVKHRLVKELQEYKWSSYQSILSHKPTLLEREFVLDWFGGSERYINYHKEANFLFEDKSFYIEEK